MSVHVFIYFNKNIFKITKLRLFYFTIFLLILHISLQFCQQLIDFIFCYSLFLHPKIYF